MKRLLLLLIPAIISSIVASAQSSCSQGHPIYSFSNAGAPRDVFKLGADPEFPFLRNLSTPQKVVAALKSSANQKKYPRQYAELNTLLVQAGFANGVKDVKASSVFAIEIAPGSTGNMGDGKFNYIYVKFAATQTFKAWKITSDAGCYICFLSPCGNALYPGSSNVADQSADVNSKPGCKEIAVALDNAPQEVTIQDTVQRHVKKDVYIYYARGYYESEPLLVDTKDETVDVPVTYRMVPSGTGKATVCNDTLKSVSEDIKLETESVYTGYKPNEVKKEYIRVPEHVYIRASIACGCCRN